jgi:alpha-N-arabinofuranosidase
MTIFRLMKYPVCAMPAFAAVLRAADLHVAPTGNDANPGTMAAPLRSIQRAADLAQPGDVVTVHEGVYRERVDPPRGGASDARRIVYQAAPGGKAIITGAEPLQGWERVGGDTWKVIVPNSWFGDFNPFEHRIQGEWCNPTGRHAGSVYLNGEWLAESLTLEPVLEPAGNSPLWFAAVSKEGADQHAGGVNTTIWAQFPGVDPNRTDVEISKRQSVFYPSKAGINHITVRGFELCRAATPWGGAMSEQVGLIGTHWSKGWIIENNHIHHSMCKGVALGRYELPHDELPPATAPGFVKSMELALRDGWSKERIGGHIVRNNHIHDCGKNAVHGSLGAAFSEISGNEIHDISRSGWVRGADTGGIKFLGGVDMIIRGNHIYRCGDAAGIWLDWSCQGALVTGNLLHDNAGHGDLFLEMQHGPLLVANNILLSPRSISINSEGVALAHNLVAGGINVFSDPRETPFHPPHSAAIAGLYEACGGDHRLINNLLPKDGLKQLKLPDSLAGNVIISKAALPRLIRKPDGWQLTFDADAAWRDTARCKLVTTASLGKATVSNCGYENPDGTPLAIDTDYLGRTRDTAQPFPGPFEVSKAGTQTIQVWPKP